MEERLKFDLSRPIITEETLIRNDAITLLESAKSSFEKGNLPKTEELLTKAIEVLKSLN